MIEPAAAEYEILVSAAEQAGLYEIIWSFNTQWEEASVGEKYAVAESVVKSLLNSGCVELWKSTLRGNAREFELIPTDIARQMLADPVVWYPSLPNEPSAFIEIGITSIGEDRFKGFATRLNRS